MNSQRTTGEDGFARLLESGFAILALCFFTGALIPLLQNPYGEGVQAVTEDPYSPIIELTIYAVASVLVLTRWRATLAMARRSPGVWAFALLALASTAWSMDPRLTLHASIALIGTMVFATWFATRFRADEQASTVAWAIALLAVASVGMALFAPSLGVDRLHVGAWRGVFVHKNTLGRVMALGYLACALLAVTGKRPRILIALAAILCGTVLVLSTSKTAIAIAAASTLFLALRPLIRSRRIPVAVFGVAAVAILAMIAVAILQHPDVFLPADALGHGGGEETLTGRTVLWGAVALKIAQRPWLGYGHQVFWNSGKELYVEVWRIAGWAAPTAHNGFLDTAVDFGVLGAGALLILIGRTAAQAIRYARIESNPAAAFWPLAAVLFLVLANLSETAMMRHGSPFWVLFSSSAMTVNWCRLRAPASETALRSPTLAVAET